MKRILPLLLSALFAVSCQAQKVNSNLTWKEFESKEAGMKVSLPCEPKKNFKSFQDEPRPIHVYEFSCEAEGMKFLISSKNYMDDFNENTFKRTFESNESILKTMFGTVEGFEKKENFLTNGLESKYYEVKLKSDGKINMLIVVSKNRSYEAMFGVTPESAVKLKESKIGYEEIGKKFIDSFSVIDK